MSEAVATAPQQDRSSTSLVEWGLLFLSPLFSFWLMHFHPVMQRGALDPYIYTGYIHNFVDLFDRYGATYYGVRFGTIIPGQIATTLFGSIAGYFVLRYALALTASVPLYLLVRQQHGRPAAAAVFAFLITSPFLARTLLWDYTDATGVPFLFASLCLYGIEHRRRLLADVSAGLLAALAIHSNVFALVPLSIFFGAHLALSLWWGREPTVVLRRLLVIAVTILVVSAAGASYYWLRVGHVDIFSITATTSVWLTGGAIADWRTPGIAWVAQQWSVVTPLVLVVLVPLVRPFRRMIFSEALLWAASAGVTAFYYVYQFLLDGTFLQLFYYFSYLLPFVFMLLSLVVASLIATADEGWRWRLAGVIAVSGIGPWILYSTGMANPGSLLLVHYAAIVAAASLLIVAAVHFPRHTSLSGLAGVALGLMLVASFAGGQSTYAGTLNSRRRPASTEMDVYNVALQLIDNVPTWKERPGVLRFWYSNLPPDNSIQSIQSTYLWGRSKVQREGPGMPDLSAADLEIIRDQRLKWLMLLAERGEQLDEGREALLRAGIQHASLARRVLAHGNYTLHLELLDLQRP